MSKYLLIAKEAYKEEDIKGGLRRGYIMEHRICDPHCTIMDIDKCKHCALNISDDEIWKWADSNPYKAAEYLCSYFWYKYEVEYMPENFLRPVSQTVRNRINNTSRMCKEVEEKIEDMMDSIPNPNTEDHNQMWDAIQEIMYMGRTSYSGWKWYLPIKYEAFRFYSLRYYSMHGYGPEHKERKCCKGPETTGKVKYIREMCDRYYGTHDEYYNDMNSMLGVNGCGFDDSDTWEPQDPHQAGGFTMYDGGWD